MTHGHMLRTRIVRSEQARMGPEDPQTKGLQERAFRCCVRRRAGVCRVERAEMPHLILSDFGQQGVYHGQRRLAEAATLYYGIEKERSQCSLRAPHVTEAGTNGC